MEKVKLVLSTPNVKQQIGTVTLENVFCLGVADMRIVAMKPLVVDLNVSHVVPALHVTKMDDSAKEIV